MRTGELWELKSIQLLFSVFSRLRNAAITENFKHYKLSTKGLGTRLLSPEAQVTCGGLVSGQLIIYDVAKKVTIYKLYHNKITLSLNMHQL